MPAYFLFVPTIAEAQHRCEIEEAQRMFGQEPRPTAEIERLLAECQTVGSTDYRVPMFLGVIARDAGDRNQAITYLRKAHEMAPQEPNPALELGFTLETSRPQEAREIYERILARSPASRPAMLGLARVARSQNRLNEAHGLYADLLAVNPRDTEALNGMAWLALADHDRNRGRAGFEQVLDIEPDNAEAKTGLSHARDVYRHLLETSGTMVSTDQGTSWGFQARGTAAVTGFDTLELGWRHFSDELTTVSATGLATLPSDNITLGYHRVMPGSYAFSLVYDYRGHSELPTEHWIDGSVTIYLTDRLQWFGGYRQSFGDARYNGRLIRTGLSATVAPSWQVTATVYNSRQAVFNDYQDLWSGLLEVTYFGPRNTLVVAGVGATPLVENFHLHARAILPVADRVAAQLIATHDSNNAAMSMTGGLLFTW